MLFSPQSCFVFIYCLAILLSHLANVGYIIFFVAHNIVVLNQVALPIDLEFTVSTSVSAKTGDHVILHQESAFVYRDGLDTTAVSVIANLFFTKS